MTRPSTRPAPAVAVTAPRRMVDGRERVTLNTAYVRALESAGLVPLAVPTMLAADRALGGTLYQDLASERPGSVPHSGETSHGVRVEPGSLLERTLGTRSATVNSPHHQAIRDLAPGLKAVAWADDGVIEGAEPVDASAAWIVAVQWHPEDLTERALFDGFARAVS